MSTQGTAPRERNGQVADSRPHRGPADVAYRNAWWSLALYPVAFVAAFVIGEGLYSVLSDGSAEPPAWVALVAATPALLVFVGPGILATVYGRRALSLGRRDAIVPVVVGAVIAVGFVGLNAVSYLAMTLFG